MNGIQKWAGLVFGIVCVSSLSACSLFPSSHYHLPDYYETRTIPKTYSVGVRYELDDLRCSQNGMECSTQEIEPRRQYEKPYYLSK